MNSYFCGLVRTAILTLFLAGCGGESIVSEHFDQPHQINKIKIGRTNWMSVTKPGESDMGALEKSLDAQNVEIKLTKGEKKGAHYQFFIDIDQDSQTGYSDEWISGGADYLIEDERVYKSLSNSDEWKWQMVAEITFTNDEKSVYTIAPRELFSGIDENFRVGAICLDQNWNYVAKIDMNSLDNGKITVDADSSDWDDISVISNSDFGEFKFYADDKNIYFMAQNGSLSSHTQIYINSDNDVNSGYLPQGGADYLIEDYRLYEATANSNGWAWKRIGYLSFAKEKNLFEVAIDKNKLRLDFQNIYVSALAWDEEFNSVVSSMDIVKIKLDDNDRKSLIISEILASNGHTIMDPDFYAFSDWIEIYNPSSVDVDIGGYSLSDSLKGGSWEIPRGTIIGAKDRMIFWADKKDIVLKGMHTDFSLKSKGEAIALFDRNDELVDGFSFGKQKTDVSCTVKNGEIVFMNPTPGSPNKTARKTLSLSQTPSFSINAGFYDTPITVAISSSQNSKIYYTTDGSYPTQNSNLYTAPIYIDKNTILRARAQSIGKFLSKEIAASYFINENIELPVVSLSTNDDYFFGDEAGIYVKGTNGATSPGCTQEGVRANYFQDWARPAHIEFFDEEKNLGFSQEIEVEISGSCSRVLPQKSLKISADDKYGNKTIEYKLFENKPFMEYEGFKLKSSGQDWLQTMIRDPFLHQVVKDDLDVDYQDYKPCVLFINGEYFGIHNIREKKNRDFIAQNHPGVKKKKIDLLYDNIEIKKGNPDDYIAMINYINSHDLTDEANYRYISTKMDIENYIDYMIAETFFLNVDWPYTNVRYWREEKEGAKWRWILEDLDSAFGPWDDPMDINIFEKLTTVDDTSEVYPPWSTFLFRSLIKNDAFKARFKQKYYNYLNSTFLPQRMHSILDGIVAKVQNQMPRHIQRWRDTYEETIGSMEMWRYYLNHMRDMINERNQKVKEELQTF